MDMSETVAYLDAYERWMVRSNLEAIAGGESGEYIVALLRARGYERIAKAVEYHLQRIA